MTSDRRRLGDALRTLRLASGLSTTALATVLLWSQSKVSRVERGVTPARPHEVAAWAAATGGDATEDLLALAARVVEHAVRQRSARAPGAVRARAEVARLAENAGSVTTFGWDFVPAPAPGPSRLLTTEAAARGRTDLGHLVGVLPSDAPVRVFSSFTVFDDALVVVPTLTRTLHVRDPREIARYLEHFEELCAASIRR